MQVRLESALPKTIPRIQVQHSSEKRTSLFGGRFCGQIGAQQYVWRPEGEDFNPKKAAAPARLQQGLVYCQDVFEPMEAVQ